MDLLAQYSEILKNFFAGGPGSGRHATIDIVERPIAKLNKLAEQWHRDEVNAWLGVPAKLKVTSTKQEMVDPTKLLVTQPWYNRSKLQDWKDAKIAIKDMPPVIVVRTNSGDYLFDGSHRAEYAKMLNMKVPATVHTVEFIKKDVSAGGPGSGRHRNLHVDNSRLTYKSPTGFAHIDRVKGLNLNEVKLKGFLDELKSKKFVYQKTVMDTVGGKQHLYKSPSGARATLMEPTGQQLARGKFNRIIYAGGPGSGRHPYGRKLKLPSVSDIQRKERILEDRRAKDAAERKAKFTDKGLSMRGKPIVSGKAQRALASANVATKAVHDLAEKTEDKVTKAVSGTKSKDNCPFDVIVKVGNKSIGIEVKALVTQKNDKITQKADAIDRKNTYAAKNKIKSMYTVAIDSRKSQTKPDVYIRQGVGSFRLAGMTKVSGGFSGLKYHLR